MVAQQWLNNRTVYFDFAACTLPTNLQTAIGAWVSGEKNVQKMAVVAKIVRV